jgi:hypothetical protein
MRSVCVSDTHGRHGKTVVPPGDLLVHAGDVTRHGRLGVEAAPEVRIPGAGWGRGGKSKKS